MALRKLNLNVLPGFAGQPLVIEVDDRCEILKKKADRVSAGHSMDTSVQTDCCDTLAQISA